MHIMATSIGLVVALLLSLTPAAWSANGSTTGPPDGSGPIAPSGQVVQFHNTSLGGCLDCYVSGVALRNQPPAPPGASGTIPVPAAVVATAIFAELYWATLTATTAPPPATETFNGVLLARVPCGGVTVDPCWYSPTGSAHAFQADVLPLLVAGPNALAGFPDSGLLATPPESEGATLVVVYEDSPFDKEIIVTCGNDSHPIQPPTFPFGYANALPVASLPGTPATLYFIGADGQTPAPVFADQVYWNGVALPVIGDSWMGLDPPGTGYWDTLTYSVFTGPPNTAVSETPGGSGDCINWVATVLCAGKQTCLIPVEPSTWGQIKSRYDNRN